MLQTMIADFQQHFWLYVSIPFMSGLIGYVTKVIAIQMMFSPLEFLCTRQISQNPYPIRILPS